MTSESPLKTALFDEHVALGARMAPFSGFLMPIQYTGTLREHEATRTAATLFDTCHMGEFRVSGPVAEADLERLLSCDVASLSPGRCRYGLLCNEDGGVLDDLLVYRLAPDAFMLVVNAGTRAKDFRWIQARISHSTVLSDLGADTAKLDLQGPVSPRILRGLVPESLTGFGFYSFRRATFCGRPILVSRTGYTGEIGFELYCAPDTVRGLWRACMTAGAIPAGLGARDTLRLEMGMPLYGHELSEQRNAAESCFTRAISMTKHFVGSEAVRSIPAKRSALAGIGMAGRRAARAGDTVCADGKRVGTVTSGSYAPSLGRAVAMAYVDRPWDAPGTAVIVMGTRDELEGVVETMPFYSRGTAREDIDRFLGA